MAYGRRTSWQVRLLNWLALGCENWFWPLFLIVVLSPVSPHVLISESSTSCSYLGGRGVQYASPSEHTAECSFIRLLKVS